MSAVVEIWVQLESEKPIKVAVIPFVLLDLDL